jgi:hypothetical protein
MKIKHCKLCGEEATHVVHFLNGQKAYLCEKCFDYVINEYDDIVGSSKKTLW